MNEYRLSYITAGHKKHPFIKGVKRPRAKEETIFAKTDESAKKKARFLIRQAYKKGKRVVHAILDRIESKGIASGEEIGEKI